MNNRWWAARIAIRRDVLLAVGLVVAAAVTVSLYLLADRVVNDGISPPELEEIARAWTEENIGGAMGDAMVDFIVSESHTEQPGILGEYLKERLDPATTWSYGPIVSVGNGRYEVTATAMTNVHQIMPPMVRDSSGSEVTIEPGDLERVATMPFHLTVDTDSKSVTDWHVHPGEATYVTAFDEERLASIAINVEETLGEAADKCIGSAAGKDLPQYHMMTLLQPPEEREPAKAVHLYDAVSAIGLNAVCREWLGDLSPH